MDQTPITPSTNISTPHRRLVQMNPPLMILQSTLPVWRTVRSDSYYLSEDWVIDLNCESIANPTSHSRVS